MDKQSFIDLVADSGRFWAYWYRLPLPAMIACAAVESAWGEAEIYKATKCPFMTQKPKEWIWPKCPTLTTPTKNKDGEQARPAPFCIAIDMSDAARIWCEWIVHWPNLGARTAFLALADRPAEFANKLPLVGFANGQANKGKGYKDIVINEFLIQPKYDAGKSPTNMNGVPADFAWTADRSNLGAWLFHGVPKLCPKDPSPTTVPQ